jgi:cell division protein DivIC
MPSKSSVNRKITTLPASEPPKRRRVDAQDKPKAKRSPSPWRKRRMRILGAVMLIFMAWAGFMWWDQHTVLQQQEQELQNVKNELQAENERQTELSAHIERLHDPEYIAELARRDYYLTKDGEMIFNISE